jgi:hypothetical protein
MTSVVKKCWQCTILFGFGTLSMMALAGIGIADKLPTPTRVWSVGPLTKPETVGSFAFGPGGGTFTGLHMDSQTGSIFSATRSIAFADDRIVLASKIGSRRVEGHPIPENVYSLLSLDVETGKIKDTREASAFGSMEVFATNDAHVIIAGRSLTRLTPDLKDAGSFDYNAPGHKHGNVEDISPDGSTLGNQTSPGFELVDTRTLEAREVTANPAVATSINNSGFITDNVHWTGKYPKDLSFITYEDASGERLLYHGNCGGRPQFVSNDLVLEPGCKNLLFIGLQGKIVRTVPVKGAYSYAGVSQNGKRFALQIATYDGSAMHSLNRERFLIFSVETGEPIAEVKPDKLAEGQSWTAFSPDGSMFVVGSPLKLTLYRLP